MGRIDRPPPFEKPDVSRDREDDDDILQMWRHRREQMARVKHPWTLGSSLVTSRSATLAARYSKSTRSGVTESRIGDLGLLNL